MQSASSDAGVVAISSRDVIIVFVPNLQTRLFQPTSRNSAPRDFKAASPELRDVCAQGDRPDRIIEPLDWFVSTLGPSIVDYSYSRCQPGNSLVSSSLFLGVPPHPNVREKLTK